MYKIIGLTLTALAIFSSVSAQKHKLPVYQTAAEKAAVRAGVYPKTLSAQKTSDFLPETFVIPGEFEESRAILVSWPYPDGPDDDYAILWSKLIDAIQYEVPAWILVDEEADTTEVHEFLNANGVTLTKYKFLIHPGDAFWARDYGPIGYYYSNQDSLGFVDYHYYDSRPKDDVVPQFLADELGIPNFRTQLFKEGGNFMTDGFGHAFYSNVTILDNANFWDPLHDTPWLDEDTRDTLRNIYHAHTLTELERLKCDGGTGHIDMYLKLLDEQTLVATQYPEIITAQDRFTIEDNVQQLQMLSCTYDRPFKIHRFAMPTNDIGDYSALTCGKIDLDPRGFINGLFVNKTFIFPSFSNTANGNVEGDSAAIAAYRKILPGYRVVPIDARLLTPLGGAIHCITSQIPADNALRFWHPSVEGFQNIQLPGFPLKAKITNRSGIEQAKCFWRKKGETQWQNVFFYPEDTMFLSEIANQNFTLTDTIEYYVWAKANNGKEATKPLTAPNGFYTFYFTQTTAKDKTVLQAPNDYMFAAYPNPTRESIAIPVFLTRPQTVEYTISDVLGRVLESRAVPMESGTNAQVFDVSHWSEGVYLYSVKVNGRYLNTRRFTVVR